MSKDLYRRLCQVETLRIAANYVFDDQKDDFIPDIFRHQDYIYNLEHNLQRLAQNLANEIYRSRPLREIDVPKAGKGISVRPGSCLDIEDHIVFFGIAYLLAPILDRVLPDRVFHFRVKKKGERTHPKELFENSHHMLLAKYLRRRMRIFGDWYDVWPEFMEEAQNLYTANEFPYLVESDITSYFENISHPLLADVLRQHAPQQMKLINMLMAMISAWATPSFWGVKPERGIPQGNEVSSWLGTLFLVQMDMELFKLQKKKLIKYVRYVDDIKVFAKDKKIARRVVLLINQLLRRMHLNMQTSKTEIFERDKIESRLFDSRVDHVTAIIESLSKAGENISDKQKAEALSEIEPIFEASFPLEDEITKRDLRFFKRILTALRLLESRKAIPICLKCIWEQPALTEKVVSYLRLWIADSEVSQGLRRCVFGDGELFEIQYLSLIPLLRQAEILELADRAKLIRIGRSKAHWAVRAEALLCLMLLPLEEQHFQQLKRLYEKEISPYVKKVILALYLKAPFKTTQPVFKETIIEIEEETNRFRKFIWSLGNNPEVTKPTLKILGKIERDPARLLTFLYGALHSKDLNVLRQIKRIADRRADSRADSNFNYSTALFKRISEEASTKLEKLNAAKAKLALQTA